MMIKKNSDTLNFASQNQSIANSLEFTAEVSDIYIFPLYGSYQAIAANPNKKNLIPNSLILPEISDTNKIIVGIAPNGFEAVPNLETVTLPFGINKIGGYAFKDCVKLKVLSITSPTVAELNIDALKNTSPDLVIYVPATLVAAYKQDSKWSEFKDRIKAAGVSPDTPIPTIASNEGCVNVLVSTNVCSNNISIIFNSYFYRLNDINENKPE